MEHWSRRSFLRVAGLLGPQSAERVNAREPPTYPLKWKIATGLDNNGVVAGVVDGNIRIFGTADEHYRPSSTGLPGFLFALDSLGRILFKKQMASGGISVFPSFLEPRGVGPCVFIACGPYTQGSVGDACLVSARNAEVVWKQRTSNQFFGNGSCVLADLDGDGEEELVYGDQAAVRCFRARDGKPKWVYGDHVSICHGRLALDDIDGDGKPELLLGTEYANQDESSSVFALDGRGKLLWRNNGIRGDMGSTPMVVADVDGDRKLEILKVELDLLHKSKMEWAGLFCFRKDGTLKYRADFGCSGMAVGDLDGDGRLEAVGITDSRDGGDHGRDEIRCLNLKTAKMKWTTPVRRTWLGSQDPVIADLTGVGELNILVSTSNPSGYGRLESQPPYGDAYVLDRHGKILWKTSLPDFIHQPFVSDIDGDGRNEMILPCHDGSIYCYATPGLPGPLWSVTGANFRRTYCVRPFTA